MGEPGRADERQRDSVADDADGLAEGPVRVQSAARVLQPHGLVVRDLAAVIFELHDATRALIEADTIPQLHELVRKIRYPGGNAFRSYMTNLRARASTLGPSERFILQRLEGIERVIGA